jgi:hypothetical protein
VLTTPASMPILRNKVPVFIDFETYYTSKLTLKRMSLRRYLAATHVTAMTIRMGGVSVSAVGDAEVQSLLPAARGLFESDEVVVVAHNNPFDLRCAHYKLGLPWPKWSLCTLDLARAAWPNLFRSYSLDALGDVIQGMPKKIKIDLHPGKHTTEELRAYVEQDGVAADYLYHAALSRLPDVELALAAMTSESRQMSLALDAKKAQLAITLFTDVVTKAAKEVADQLGMETVDYSAIFGMDMKTVRSVKPAAVKAMLMENLGFRTDTISIKKINPEKLRRDPKAGATLRALGKVNGTLSHTRRVSSLLLDDEVDLNLRYAGSHTYRWTSTGEGKGVNFLNLPKHDKAVAKPLRQIISVKDRMLVRGDASSLEYRMVGWWCRSKHVQQLFESNLFADPYIAFGHAATGQWCGPKDPVRQVWKTSVLGLGFLMRPRTHALNIAKMLATEVAAAQAEGRATKISLNDLEALCRTNNWHMPQTPYYKEFRTKSGLPEAVIAVAHHTHELFHQIHPEIPATGRWITAMLETVAASSNPEQALAGMLKHRAAPNPDVVKFEIDHGMYGRSIKITCGPWVPTLRWSNLGVRRNVFGDIGLCVSTTRGDKFITENLSVENITQALGRNGMAHGLLKLWTDGWPAPLNVHDEGLIAVPPDCGTIVRARDAMAETFGPGGYVSKDFGWACVMEPKKITVSKTMWDADPDDICPDFWKRVEAGDQSVLDLCP